jgi:hypothetical protein
MANHRPKGSLGLTGKPGNTSLIGLFSQSGDSISRDRIVDRGHRDVLVMRGWLSVHCF